MSDNKEKKDFRDRDRININEEYEVQYWSEYFGITEQKLKEAVKIAGPLVAKVRKELHKF